MFYKNQRQICTRVVLWWELVMETWIHESVLRIIKPKACVRFTKEPIN